MTKKQQIKELHEQLSRQDENIVVLERSIDELEKLCEEKDGMLTAYARQSVKGSLSLMDGLEADKYGFIRKKWLLPLYLCVQSCKLRAKDGKLEFGAPMTPAEIAEKTNEEGEIVLGEDEWQSIDFKEIEDALNAAISRTPEETIELLQNTGTRERLIKAIFGEEPPEEKRIGEDDEESEGKAE